MSTTSPRLGRLDDFIDLMASALGHADRKQPCSDYLQGLLLPGDRKSMEPIASRLDPKRIVAKHQSIQHFITDAPWDEYRLLDAARNYALPFMMDCGGVTAWVIDDTGIPKKGKCSVGVGRQYCGVLGKQDNCQTAVSVSLANEKMSLPVSWRLYLPESWTDDRKRMKKAKVPESVVFLPKWEVALAEIDRLDAVGTPSAPVLADAGYGRITDFREGLSKRNKTYAVGVLPEQGVVVMKEGQRPREGQRGDCRTIALGLQKKLWKTVSWRDGSDGKPQTSRFATVRVRATHKVNGKEPIRPTEWLICEWPSDEPEPTKYWLSTLPETAMTTELVRVIKLRWRIERDYQELKGELGLDHFEGRSWRGFHHHGALCLAAYSFIAVERARGFPPSRPDFLPPKRAAPNFRPRGSPARTNRLRT